MGALVTGQLGHRYAAKSHAIRIGSGQKLTLFDGIPGPGPDVPAGTREGAR